MAKQKSKAWREAKARRNGYKRKWAQRIEAQQPAVTPSSYWRVKKFMERFCK